MATQIPVDAEGSEHPEAEKQNPYEGVGMIEVPDVNGFRVPVFPGHLEGGARHLYRNGQCLAMAVALSRREGWSVVTREIELKFEAGPKRILHHAYALSHDGYLVDADGAYAWNGDMVRGWRSQEIMTVYGPEKVDDLLQEFSRRTLNQDVPLAETFLHSVIELYVESRLAS